MKIENKRQIAINVLIPISIVMFFSLFTGMSKLIGSAMLLWVLCVGYNMKLMFDHSNISLSEVVEYNGEQTTKYFKEKKYGKFVIYGLALPLCIVGIIMVGLIIIGFFTFI